MSERSGLSLLFAVLVATASTDRMVHLWNPDGKWIATGDQDGMVSLWEVAAGGRVRRTLPGHGASVFGVGFNPDGSRLVSCSADGQVKVWDWKAGAELLTLPLPGGGLAWHAVFSPDGKRVAAAAVSTASSHSGRRNNRRRPAELEIRNSKSEARPGFSDIRPNPFHFINGIFPADVRR